MKISCVIFSLFDIYLHFAFDVYNSNVLEDLLKRVLSKREEYADTWHAMQEKLLFIYKEALSANCGHLVQMIQVILCNFLEVILVVKTIV